MKKSELTAFIKEEILSTLTTEGVWSKGDDTAIRDFILDVEQLKDDYYNIVGSDDVFNGLDLAIKAANDLIDMDLNESTEEEIAKTKELTSAVKDLEAAKKEAGIEENELDPLPPLSKNFADLSPEEMRRVGIEYDYEDIGQFYLERSGKEHNLTNDQLGKLGRQITDKLYGGDLGKAYDDVVRSPIDAAAKRLADQGQLSNPRYVDGTSIKEEAKKEAGLSEENIGLDDLQDIGYDDGEYAFDKHFNKSILKNRLDTKYYSRGFVQAIIDSAQSLRLNESEDKEPTKADLKKTKGLAKAKEELALLTREMKSLAKKYSKAEGEEKEKIVADLKKKTKLKKELETIIDK